MYVGNGLSNCFLDGLLTLSRDPRLSRPGHTTLGAIPPSETALRVISVTYLTGLLRGSGGI